MTQEQRSNSKLLWGLVATIIIVIALFFTYQWLNSSSTQLSTEIPSPTFTEQKPAVEATPPATPAVELTAVETAASTPSTAPTAAALPTPVKLVDENILATPVPNNETLAKEEVSKLEDIQSQLVDQEKTLKEQHATADDLIKLKEEQIALLEAQLAKQ